MKTLLALISLAGALCFAQENSMQDMPGMNMQGHDMSKMSSADPSADSDASAPAMKSMEGHHMEMGAHMKMTALRNSQPGDAERAQKVVDAARNVMEKYKDYHVALDDGFKIFLPNIPQKQYHFSNRRFAIEAESTFNPEHPTSLLYEKNGDGYRLVGLMYTAPKRFTEDDLNARIPLSIAQWHEHVNFCRAPFGHWSESFGTNPKFGMRGSISTQQDCDAAGGKFIPLVFNWMVHLYPMEKTTAEIWSVEKQHAD
jgi:hypothetical protein